MARKNNDYKKIDPLKAKRICFTKRISAYRAVNISHFGYTKSFCQYINKIERDGTVLFTAKLLYMFRVSIAPIIRVHHTVTAASGTGHSVRATTLRY